MIEETFGSRLRALRQARRLTQAHLAARSGVALRTLAYWEAGQHIPGHQELDSIVRALQLTLEERQALTALLPVGKVGRVVRAMPAWTGTAPPPGTGDLIRALRWRRRLSREQLAGALGVHRTTVKRWEEWQAVPSAETKMRLCSVLDALPAERAVLLASGDAAPLWEESPPTLDACREKTAQLECESVVQTDPLFDLRAHLLAGTLWNLSTRLPDARPLLAQTYAAHAAFSCLRGDDAAALDYAERSLSLIRQGAAPPETAWYRALWAGSHALAHHAPHSGPKQSLQQAKQWLPIVQTPDVRAFLLLSAAWWAVKAGSLPEARDYWRQTRTLTDRLPHPNHHFVDSIQSVYADLLVKEGSYEKGLKVNAQVTSDLYARQIVSLLFQTDAFLKAGDRNEADSALRRAYGLIAAHQVDLYRKDADGFAAQLERIS